MGHIEPWRAQLTILSMVPSAYSTPLRGVSSESWFEPTLARSNALLACCCDMTAGAPDEDEPCDCCAGTAGREGVVAMVRSARGRAWRRAGVRPAFARAALGQLECGPLEGARGDGPVRIDCILRGCESVAETGEDDEATTSWRSSTGADWLGPPVSPSRSRPL